MTYISKQAEDGSAVIQLRAEEGTVWLTRTEIADLFQTTPQNITLHIQGICEEGEVNLGATSKDYLLVQTEGERSVQREVKLYDLKMILAIGCRIRPSRSTQFRKWTTTHLQEYLDFLPPSLASSFFSFPWAFGILAYATTNLQEAKEPHVAEILLKGRTVRKKN